MIKYQYYPRNATCPSHLIDVYDTFSLVEGVITSSTKYLSSNAVLEIVRPGLEQLNYKVESGKRNDDKINIPVMHGVNGKIEKSFDADAYNKQALTVIEVEAGRAVTNYQFLKDLFQASVMEGVEYLVIAVRLNYRKKNDFEQVIKFMDAMYLSNRLKLPLKGLMIIGY